jgi:eukaryotic-like serine/threonine-protein kinase
VRPAASMDEDRRRRIDALFCELLERPASERDALLEERCGDDAPLRAALERLLAAAEEEDGFLTPGGALQGAVWQTLSTGAGAAVPAPERIGAYRVLRELGRGGMSVVYLGERADGAFEQRVALKLVKPGADTEEVLQRFGQERQILATLAHPAIARLLDGGTTDSGRPYFVMELVEGEPIDAWCRARDASIEQRLGLLLGVCEAVQHAHERQIVHRDLKPSNILVEVHGQVKLLDFGIAKVLDPGTLPGVAPATRLALRPLTPEFASPEQVRGEAVTTASDVYQLGLLLYLLLTDRPPYRVEGEGSEALARAICDQVPLPPSSRLTGRHAWRLRGDLDNIVMTALRKEPERRYASAAELAADLRRHLAGEPVVARRDSVVYRLRKGLRRNAAALVAAASVAFAAGIVGVTSWQNGERHASADSRGQLAVLPFANLGGQEEDRYLSDGIAEELIDRLAAGGVPVIARTSSFAFREQPRPVPELAALLGASWLLEGSVRREDARVRVSAKLVDAQGRAVWSERFERRLEGIFDLQDEIAGAVVANVAPALQWAGARQRAPTADLEAYRHYLHGRDLERRRPPRWVPAALDAYRAAIDLDPGFAAAWAGFAVATRLSAQWSVDPRREIQLAQQAVDRALEIDPGLAEAHAAQGLIHSMRPRAADAPQAAEAALRRALELNPRLSSAYNWLAIELLMQNRVAEAIELREAALAIDPVNPLLLTNAARADHSAGQYQRARNRLTSVLRLPDPPYWTYGWLAELEADFGRLDQALAWIERGAGETPAPTRFILLAEGADYYARLGLQDQAQRVIERAEQGLQGPLPARLWRLKYPPGNEFEYQQALHAELQQLRIDTGEAADWLRAELGTAQAISGAYEDGIATLEAVLGGDFRRTRGQTVSVYNAVHYLAWAYRRAGREARAMEILRSFHAALESERAQGQLHSPAGIAVLARNHALLGEPEAAIAHTAGSLRRRLAGPLPPGIRPALGIAARRAGLRGAAGAQPRGAGDPA